MTALPNHREVTRGPLPSEKSRLVTASEYCRLLLSRRKLARDHKGTRTGLIDEQTGESFWIEEAKLWLCGGLGLLLAVIL